MQFYTHKFSSLDTCNFNAKDYSRLKIGSTRVADDFGKEMAIQFYNEFKYVLSHGNVVILPSAFNMLEIAAYLLAKQFMQHLNILLAKANMPIVKWSIIHRTISYFKDYAKLSEDERTSLLSKDKFFINRDFIKNKTLVFVDDVYITGTHERKIKEFVREEQLNNQCIFAYYCMYSGSDPTIESKLNTVGVSCEQDYIDTINEPNHKIIVRTCKYVLNLPVAQCKELLLKLSDSYINDLYNACILEEYHINPEFSDTFQLLNKRLSKEL